MIKHRAVAVSSLVIIVNLGALGACSSDEAAPAAGAGATSAMTGGAAGLGGSVNDGGRAGAGAPGSGGTSAQGGTQSTAAGGNAQAGEDNEGGTGGTATASGGGSGTGGAVGGTGGAVGGTGGAASGTGGGSGTGGAVGGTGGAASGGSGGSGGGGATASPGCGMAPVQALGQFVEQPTLTIAGVTRHWWVQLPSGYTPTKAYPLIFLFHGCSNENNNVPMGNVAGKDAILVRGAGVSSGVCWDSSSNGPDLTFFDQMLAGALAQRCVDTSRVFAAGYSSGSWLINMLECKRGDKLRATGTVSGGTPGNPNNCLGKFARVFVHDADDHDNEISGSIKERDRVLAANHCNAATAAVAEAPAPCARYQGCDAGYPVLWCQTSGKGHDRQDALAPAAFWGIFGKL